jgi:hypothetical protein
MARDHIPDLWSDDIRADILTPTMILKAQARALTRRTRGLIAAEVFVQEHTSMGAGHPLLVLRLDGVAAASDNQRYSLFSVAHHLRNPYPAALICASKEVADWVRRSKALSVAPPDLLPNPTEPELTVFTDAQTAFLAALEALVRSNEVRSLLHSIIAASNEATNGEGSSPDGGEEAEGRSEEAQVPASDAPALPKGS